MNLRALLFVCLIFSIGLPCLMGQSTFGSIVGVVTDSSSAAVPDAVVEITNPAENTTRSTVTNGQGAYEAVNLKPGNYKIVVKKNGFSSVEMSGVVLEARQERRADIT